MIEDGNITKQEEATLAEAIEIMGRWLEAHKEEGATLPGYWGIQEAHVQIRLNLCFMVDDLHI